MSCAIAFKCSIPGSASGLFSATKIQSRVTPSASGSIPKAYSPLTQLKISRDKSIFQSGCSVSSDLVIDLEASSPEPDKTAATCCHKEFKSVFSKLLNSVPEIDKPVAAGMYCNAFTGSDTLPEEAISCSGSAMNVVSANNP